MELLIECRTGYPNELSEVVIRFYERDSKFSEENLVLYALWHLGKYEYDKVKNLLVEKSKEGKAFAFWALCTSFLRDEYITRVNSKKEQKNIHDSIFPIVLGWPSKLKILYLPILLAHICYNPLGVYEEFKNEYEFLKNYWLDQLDVFFDGKEFLHKNSIRTVINSYAVLTASALVAESLEKIGEVRLSEHFYEINSIGELVPYGKTSAGEHLNYGFMLIKSGKEDEAEAFLNWLIKLYPEEFRIQFEVLRYLQLLKKSNRDKLIDRCESLKESFNLNQDDIKDIEDFLAFLKE